jgi:hypothetical protein
MAEKKVTEEKVSKKSKGKGGATPLRIWSAILWVLAIGLEVFAIYIFNNNATFFGLSLEVCLIGTLVLDAILCIIAAQIWKKSNDLAPIKSKSKFVRFVWYQLGVIMAAIAFIPFVIILFTKKDVDVDLDPKMKKIIGIIAIGLFLLVGTTSIDFDPPTAEAANDLERVVAEQTEDFEVGDEVYWTSFGKSFHTDTDCRTIARSTNRSADTEGTITNACETKKEDPCDVCTLVELPADLAAEIE